MTRGKIKSAPPVTASADIMAMARENCAVRLRAKGGDTEAEAFDRGERDFTWAMKHEVRRLQSEGIGK